MQHATAVESLVSQGVKRDLAATVAPSLEDALSLITDPAQRTAEFAGALAELRDGQIPNIIKRLVTGVLGGDS
jgi:hypothetical protein